MLARMDSVTFLRWWEFYRIEPWGASVEDHRAGMVCATVAEMSGKVLREGTRVKPSDYFPSRIPEPEPDVDAQVMAIFGPMVKGTTDGDC